METICSRQCVTNCDASVMGSAVGRNPGYVLESQPDAFASPEGNMGSGFDIHLVERFVSHLFQNDENDENDEQQFTATPKAGVRRQKRMMAPAKDGMEQFGSK